MRKRSRHPAIDDFYAAKRNASPKELLDAFQTRKISSWYHSMSMSEKRWFFRRHREWDADATRRKEVLIRLVLRELAFRKKEYEE